MPAKKIDPSDLRQRILDTSEALLESDGIAALSLREVARRAGVTHQAPYHHFADREAVLAALVTRGFDDLARRLARANDKADAADARATALGCSSAYVGFAIDHPGVFRVMFRPDLCDAARFPEAQEAGARAYGELLRLVVLLHGAADPGRTLASVYWSLVHGLAGLIVDGPLGWDAPSPRARRALMTTTLERFVDLVLGAPLAEVGQLVGQSPPTPRRRTR